jgi:hypothetical protein
LPPGNLKDWFGRKKAQKGTKKVAPKPLLGWFCESLCIFVAENNVRHSAGHIRGINIPECLKLVPFGSPARYDVFVNWR